MELLALVNTLGILISFDSITLSTYLNTTSPNKHICTNWRINEYPSERERETAKISTDLISSTRAIIRDFLIFCNEENIYSTIHSKNSESKRNETWLAPFSTIAKNKLAENLHKNRTKPKHQKKRRKLRDQDRMLLETVNRLTRKNRDRSNHNNNKAGKNNV